MMPKKKRIAVAIAIATVILVIIGIVFILLYINTDMFKSNQTLFIKYLGKNTENLESFMQTLESTESDKLLENSKYTQDIGVKLKYTQNMGTTQENTNNSINNLKLTVAGQVDKTNKYNYENIKLYNKDEQISQIEYIQNDNKYGIRFSDLFKQFILVENSNLKDLFEKLGYTQEQLQDIPDSVSFNLDELKTIKFTKEEIETLRQKYIEILNKDVTKQNFTKKTKQTIQINGENAIANAYTLNLTKEQLSNMYLNILGSLKEDEIVLSKIDEIQTKVKEINHNTNLKEDFTDAIDNKMEEINKTNIGSDATKITVYESKGKIIRTIINDVNSTVTIDYLENDKDKNLEITVEKEEKEVEKYTLNANQDGIEITIKTNENETPTTTILKENKKIEENNCIKNYLISYANSDNKIETNIEYKTNIVEAFENEITLNGENNIVLNEMKDSTQLQNLIGNITSAVNEKVNVISEQINVADIKKMLQEIGFIKDRQILTEQRNVRN